MSNDSYLLLKKKRALAKKLAADAESSAVSDRIIFTMNTDYGKCGKTDTYTYLQLETPIGNIYPAKDDWYVLNNPEDKMECGDSNIFAIETGDIEFCYKMRLQFITNSDNPDWNFDNADLVKWRWYPTQNRWRPVDIINNWWIKECIKETGIYEFESDGPTLPLPNKQEEYNNGIDFLHNNQDSFNKSLTVLEETLGISQLMSLMSKLINRTPIANCISNSEIPNMNKPEVSS